MKIIKISIKKILPYARNPRNNRDAVDGVAASIREFGWQQPIVLDKNMTIIAGHTRFEAAKLLGETEVPCVLAEELTEQQVKAYRLVDNKLAEKSDWAEDLLKLELEGLESVPLLQDLFSFNNSSTDSETKLELKTIATSRPPRKTWVLIGIDTVKFGEISKELETIANNSNCIIETTSNDG